MSRSRLVVIFYANPAQYPPTCNAIRILAQHFDIHVVSRNVDTATITWPPGVRVLKVGPFGYTRARAAESTHAKLREFGRFVRAVRQILVETTPQVVIAYEPHALVAANLARCRAPIVYQRHEVEELTPLQFRSFGDWIALAARALSRSAALIIFPERMRSEYYQRHVRGISTPVIVPNFPLLTTFPPPDDWPSLLETRWKRREIFYRGSIGTGMGPREALLALAHLPPPFHLRVCGFGPADFARELEQTALQMGYPDRYTNEGFIPAYEVLNQRTYQASVGVMLYRPVTTNTRFTAAATNKIYEYAACGVPVVAPDRAGFRELLGGERWVEFADELEPRSVADAIGRIFADRGMYEDRCHAARAAFEERFHYERVFQPVLSRILNMAEHSQ